MDLCKHTQHGTACRHSTDRMLGARILCVLPSRQGHWPMQNGEWLSSVRELWQEHWMSKKARPALVPGAGRLIF